MMTWVFSTIWASLIILSHPVQAEIRPEKIFEADVKKTGVFVQDGIIRGGDQAINEVTVKDIRRANNSGFERIVIDLEGTRNGKTVAIPRPPYFQMSVTPSENRLTVSIWGSPRL